MTSLILPNRRQVLAHAAFGAAAFMTPGLFAEQLATSAQMTEGPFYPDRMPLDTDNDLLILNDAITPAVGQITHLSGRVIAGCGTPLRNAFVEIWQVCNGGAYIHTGSGNKQRQDRNFQGYGRFLTNVKGEYYFRTIKPVAYPGRTPHIHIAVSRNGRRIFTSQILIQGDPRNDKDFLYRRIQGEAARQSVLAHFKPIPGSKLGELAANFDIVLGVTAQETETGKLQGGISKPQFNRRR